MKYFVFLLLSLPAISAFSNTMSSVVAKVTDVGTYGSGSVYVFFDRQISSCGTFGRLDIPVDSPARDSVLSIAMAAHMADKYVKVHPVTCANTSAKLGSSASGFFYLTSEKPE